MSVIKINTATAKKLSNNFWFSHQSILIEICVKYIQKSEYVYIYEVYIFDKKISM